MVWVSEGIEKNYLGSNSLNDFLNLKDERLGRDKIFHHFIVYGFEKIQTSIVFKSALPKKKQEEGEEKKNDFLKGILILIL